MTEIKICKFPASVSMLINTVAFGFFLISLLAFFGVSVAVYEEFRRGIMLSLSPKDTIITILILLAISGMGIGFMLLIMTMVVTLNIKIKFHHQGFQITSPLIYKSNWLTWDNIAKVRKVPILNFVPIGIEGLGWMFKFNGLIYWLLPHGAIMIGKDGMINGEKFLELLRQKRPDLFTS